MSMRPKAGSEMQSHLTSWGIPGIGTVPYGMHLCHFYDSRQDLIDALIPYFVAGLTNNERCIWVTSTVLSVNEIMAEVAQSRPLQQGVKRGQLTVIDAIDWFGPPSMLNAEEIVQSWVAEEQRALARGFQGLRVTGDTSFVPGDHWSSLMEYEEKLHHSLKNRRILVFCSYHRQQCQPVDMLEVVHSHDGAVDQPDGNWQVFLQPSKFDHLASRSQSQSRSQSD